MYLTEEEVKNKWCPFKDIASLKNFIIRSHCIASECMMWRWNKEEKKSLFIILNTECFKRLGNSSSEEFKKHVKSCKICHQASEELFSSLLKHSVLRIMDEKLHIKQGYCGLGGK